MAKTAAGQWSQVAPELDGGYGTTFRRLTRIFRSRGFASEEADEFAQEAIARVLSHLSKHGRRSTDLNPLLNTIAKNLVVERFRTGGREVAVPLDERIVSDLPEPSEVVSRRERARRVHLAMNDLTAPQRRALLMWTEGLKPAEIAQHLGINRNAVDALLHRGRRQLATRLADCRDAVWGLGGAVVLRARLAARRVAEWSRAPELANAVGPAMVALASVALFAAANGESLDGGSPKSGASAGVVAATDEAVLSRAAPSEVVISRPTTARPIGHATPPNGVNVDIGQQRASVVTEATNPATGQKGPLGIAIYREPEEDEGISGAVFNGALAVICGAPSDVCEGG